MKYSRFASVLFLALFGFGIMFLYGCRASMSIAPGAELGADTLGVATNKAPLVPDCRTSIETLPEGRMEPAFVECWREVMNNCEKAGRTGAARLIRVGDEYHVYRSC